jgi:hypothetical protein
LPALKIAAPLTKRQALVWIEPVIVVKRYRGLPLRWARNAFERGPRVTVADRKPIDARVPVGEPAVDDPRADLSGLLFGKNDGRNSPQALLQNPGFFA